MDGQSGAGMSAPSITGSASVATACVVLEDSHGRGELLLMDETGGMGCGWWMIFREMVLGLGGRNKCYVGVGFLVVGVS